MIPRLHVITDDDILGRVDFLPVARKLIRSGGPDLAFHIRGPSAHGKTLFGLAEELEPEAREAGALLLVNDRLDVALALDLSGAHLGQRSLPVSVARELLGPGRILGVSVHSPEEARGVGAGADYLLVGTLFPSASHRGGAVGGLDLIRDVWEVRRLPLLGIGGITPVRVPGVLDAGAYGVAVRGAIWDAPDPAGMAGVFLNELASRSIMRDEQKGEVS